MNYKRKLPLPLCLILCIITSFTGCGPRREAISRTGFYFDTVIQVTIYDADKISCLDECMKLAEKYEKMLSPTVEGSDIWNINHSLGTPVEVNSETALLLQTALNYCDMTYGRIDITMQTVSELWDFHSEHSEITASSDLIPEKEKLEEALTHVSYHNVIIEGGTVTLSDSDTHISLGFIAKGYIADKMKEYLLSNGIENAIINLGGNLLAVGKKPDGSPFQFGIQMPFDSQGAVITVLPVSDKSAVSSGVYERYFYQDDVLYHHILNSTTGCPVQNELLSVTILSDSSMTGDALSTTCFVLGLDEGMTLVESLEDVEAVFITQDYALHYSSGFTDTDA